MKTLEDAREMSSVTNANPRVPVAIIVGAIIIAVGTFVTNNLHDWKERGERTESARKSADCRHWEESARLAAYSQAETLSRSGAGDDVRLNPDYWVALDKVQGWYAQGTAPDAPHVSRPKGC